MLYVGPKGVEHPRTTRLHPARHQKHAQERKIGANAPLLSPRPGQLTMFHNPKPISVVITLSIFWFAFRFTGLRFLIRSSSSVAFTRQ